MSSIRRFRPLWAAITAVAIAEFVVCAPSAAQQLASTLVLNPLLISATRNPTPESNVASTVTLITDDDIEAHQNRALPDVLMTVPGLHVVQGGGPGGTTSVFMRGTNPNHTKVFIDGVDVSNPSSFNNAFDFAHLLAAPIERVEVLRGPQSGLYGSDAIGGVINIITKPGSGPPRLTGMIEGGSFGTFNQTGALRGSFDRFSYAFDVEHFHSADTPVTPLDLLPPGRQRIGDSYDNKSFGAKLGAKVTDDVDVGLVARYIDTSLGITGDDFSVFPSVPAASQGHGDTRQLFTRGTARQVLFAGVFDHTFGVGYTNDRNRDFFPGAAPTYNRGDRLKFDWQGNLRLVEGEILTFGAEHQVDAIRDSPVSAQVANDAGFVQLQSSFAERLFNTISVRHDGNDRFGGETTFRIAPALLIAETGTKLKGTVGTGFKAPTLNQLFVDFPAFGFFANPDLRPETSLGYDFGFEQSVPDQQAKFGATYFHNAITDLIAPNALFTTNININQATTRGVEIFGEYRPFEPLALRADYTYTLAMDDILHQQLLRRPRHKASLDARWRVTDQASLTATVLYVGSWADGDRTFTVSGLRTTPYTVANLSGSYDLGHGVTAFARINNLFDRQYQDPTGFLRPGLGVFAGLKVAFDAGHR